MCRSRGIARTAYNSGIAASSARRISASEVALPPWTILLRTDEKRFSALAALAVSAPASTRRATPSRRLRFVRVVLQPVDSKITRTARSSSAVIRISPTRGERDASARISPTISSLVRSCLSEFLAATSPLAVIATLAVSAALPVTGAGLGKTVGWSDCAATAAVLTSCSSSSCFLKLSSVPPGSRIEKWHENHDQKHCHQSDGCRVDYELSRFQTVHHDQPREDDDEVQPKRCDPLQTVCDRLPESLAPVSHEDSISHVVELWVEGIKRADSANGSA